ncbi:histone H2A [Thecamonas trahens ATCC 50062]|uniref:Histone H2A n=1 Tax=Thecamonas trahens ATCC 50062 TaxID=461836 RepID=A0A0L0D1A7_THETB|nr:histone H2A [Thecamonas trahens ATCC 50062]KNC46027.1 histone H2A [Thecamonas trahens ATCC 50062]|eukprot:XP_013763007.1 histone H2A [Thecamonas trahens ATCC 50062]
MTTQSVRGSFSLPVTTTKCAKRRRRTQAPTPLKPVTRFSTNNKRQSWLARVARARAAAEASPSRARAPRAPGFSSRLAVSIGSSRRAATASASARVLRSTSLLSSSTSRPRSSSSLATLPATTVVRASTRATSSSPSAMMRS